MRQTIKKFSSFNSSFSSSRGSTTNSKIGSPTRMSTARGKNPGGTGPPTPAKDPEVEAREKLLSKLLQKRRVMMSGFKDEDLRDVADVVVYGSADEKAEKPTGPLIMHVRNALGAKPSERTPVYNGYIIAMIKSTDRLKQWVEFCSDKDLLSLSKMCNSFLVTKDSQHVIATAGSAIDECYIIIKGSVDRFQNPALSEKDLESFATSGKPVDTIEGYVQTLSVGTMLGADVLDNRKTWDSDFLARDGTCICTISVNALRRFVGIGGFRAEDVMECFWKYYKLWEYVHNPVTKSPHLADPLFAPLVQLTADFEIAKSEALPLNLVKCARIKTFSTGQEIFSQDEQRDYLYIVVMGECTLLRRFPDWVEDIPLEVKLGLTLYPGDFSFMDGEGEDWASNSRRAHLEQSYLQGAMDDGRETDEEQSDTYRKLFVSKLKHRDILKTQFGFHKNTLLATTRVEVVVIPLVSIAQCQSAFKGLLTIATRKYRLTSYSEEDLIRRYHENRIWRLQKCKIVSNTLRMEINPPADLAPPCRRQPTAGATGASRSFGGTLDESVNLGAGLIDAADIEIEMVESNQEVSKTPKKIGLLNARRRDVSPSGSREKSISPTAGKGPRTPNSATSSNEGVDSNRRTNRRAIQGVRMSDVEMPVANAAIAKSRNRTSSPINRATTSQSRGSVGGGISSRGTISDRIQSFVRATSAAVTNPNVAAPQVPMPPSGIKKSHQSVRVKKAQHTTKNNENKETNSKFDIPPPNTVNSQLSLIKEENSTVESILSGVLKKSESVSGTNTSSARGKRGVRPPATVVEDPTATMQAFAEKSAEYYVQKYRKKKQEMRLRLGTPQSAEGIRVRSPPKAEVDDTRKAQAQTEAGRGLRDGSGGGLKKKKNIDEIISILENVSSVG